MKSIIEVTERERIEISEIGSSSDRENFLRNFKGILQISKEHSWFSVAGVFQVGKSCCIVKPWFLDNAKDIIDSSLKSFRFLEQIKSIKVIANSISLESQDSSKFSIEILVRCLLMQIKFIVIDSLKKNFFSDRNEVIPTIRGQWLIHRDLRFGSRPLKFECRFNEAEPNSPCLVLVKSFLTWLQRIVSSQLNSLYSEEILEYLHSIDWVEHSNDLVNSARNFSFTLENGDEWLRIINDIVNLRDTILSSSPTTGLAYKFEMDRFFEELIEDSLEVSGIEFLRQKRLPLMGGSYWTLNGSNAKLFDSDEDSGHEDEIMNSYMHAKPDIVALNGNDEWVCDCKYKPFHLPLHKNFDRSILQKSFSRDDRNQILSFILSYRAFKKLSRVKFAVLYPDLHAESFSVHSLIFPFTSFEFNIADLKLIQNFQVEDEEKNLIIIFFGLNISWILLQLSKRRKFASEIFDAA